MNRKIISILLILVFVLIGNTYAYTKKDIVYEGTVSRTEFGEIKTIVLTEENLFGYAIPRIWNIPIGSYIRIYQSFWEGLAVRINENYYYAYD